MTDAELTDAAIAAFVAELGRTLTDVETTQATQRVKGALVVIRGRLGQALPGVEDGALIYVLSEVLLARSRNPEGYQYEAIDDYRYGLPAETRRVTILDEWWALLRPASTTGAHSTRPTFEPDLPPCSGPWA